MTIIEKLPKLVAALGSVGFLTMAMAAQPVWAAKPQPKAHLQVFEVFVDGDILTIIGENFVDDSAVTYVAAYEAGLMILGLEADPK